MQTHSPLLRIVLCCAADADEAAAELARRLRIERFDAQLLGEGDAGAAQAQQANDLIASADVLVLCLSPGAADVAGKLRPMLAMATEAAAQWSRPLLMLRLAGVSPPPQLNTQPSIDYYAQRGHERLMRALWGYIAARRAAPPPAPEPASPAAEPAPSDAFALAGAMVLPELLRQGLLRRLGDGLPLRLLAIRGERAIVASGGGAALLDLHTSAALWTIDCPARSAALSADGQLLALGDVDQVYLWDLRVGQLAATLASHEGAVTALAFAPDASLLAAGDTRAIRLWRPNAQAVAPLDLLRGHDDAIIDLAFAPDGATLASASLDRTARLWRTLDRAPLRVLRGHGRAVERVAFAPSGALLATAGNDRVVRLWRTSDGVPLATLEGHTSAVQAIAFAPDGAALASGSEDRSTRVWQMPGAGLLAIAAPSTAVADVAFAPDGMLGTLDRAGGLRLWQLEPQPLPLHSGVAGNAALSALTAAPNGALLAAGGRDGRIWIWRPHDGTLLYTLTGHSAPVTGLAFSADNATLLSAALDRSLRWWRLDSGSAQQALSVAAPIRTLALAPNGKRLALALEGGEVVIMKANNGRWATDDAQAGSAFIVHRSSLSVRGLCWHPSGKVLALGGDDGSVRLWGSGGDERAVLAGHSNWVRAVAFSPDGLLLASAGDDRSVRLWRSSGALLHTYKGHSGNVTGVAFIGTHTLASASLDRSVRVWSVGDGTALATLRGHAGSVERVAALPATRQIASASSDGTIRLWNMGQ